MQSVYGYLRGKQDGEHKKKKKQDMDPYPDTMDLLKERERGAFFNQQESVFDREESGLNATRSVFDQTAVFHAGRR